MATTSVSSMDLGQIEKKKAGFLTQLFSRIVTIPPTVIMILIGLRFIVHPNRGLAETGVTLSTPEAFTDMRVVGALALTIAFVLAQFLFSRRWSRAANVMVIALMGSVLAVRMFGFSIDGTTLAMGTQKVKFTGEVVFLTLNSIAFALQSLRSRQIGVRQ
jgi:hypothetical protein